MNIPDTCFPKKILDLISQKEKELNSNRFKWCSCDQGTCNSCKKIDDCIKEYSDNLKRQYVIENLRKN